MFNKNLQQVIGVAPGAVAVLTVQPEAATLVGVRFTLGGTTFDTSKINRVRVKIGPRVIQDLTGAQLLAINAYKNGASNTKQLWLDFAERDQANFPIKEIGGIDLMSVLSVGQVNIELTIDATAVAPTVVAQGYFEAPQGNSAVLKMLPFSFSQAAAGKFTLPLQLRGAMLKRLWMQYSGTNWTASANGNISRLECKKNGLVFSDLFCLDNRFDQAQNKKVPQGNFYVADFIVDNNHDANVATMRRLPNGQLVYDAFEFNAYLTDAGGSNVTVIAEVLDAVTNL